MDRVTKYVSINLLGETPKEEKKRLTDARIKSILAGQEKEVREEMRRGGKNYLVGTTPYQRKRRRDILKKGGLPY